MIDYETKAKHILLDHLSRYYPARRLACQYCHAPIRWDRDGLCQSCIKDMKEGFYDRVTTTKKELLT